MTIAKKIKAAKYYPCGPFVQSHLRDSNPGPQLYESCALPTELRWRDWPEAQDLAPKRRLHIKKGAEGVSR